MSDNVTETPLLVGQVGPLNGQRWMIKHSIVVGRDSTCDIIIPDRQVSRKHARISPSTGGIKLEDLGSKNGTHHNGKRIRDEVVLQDGDTIQIALSQEFVFISADATMPLDGDLATPLPANYGKLKLLKHSRQVWIGDQEVLPPLSVAQFNLLETLYNHSGQVMPRFQLTTQIWGEDEALNVSDQALDALVRRLRDRLANVDPTHNYIVTVRGHGLKLDNPKIEK